MGVYCRCGNRIGMPAVLRLALLLLPLLLVVASGEESSKRVGEVEERGRRLYTVTPEQMENVEEDPWTPCQVQTPNGPVKRFCRLSCAARWAASPDNLNCETLVPDEHLRRTYGKGADAYRRVAQDSFSVLNSGGGVSTGVDL